MKYITLHRKDGFDISNIRTQDVDIKDIARSLSHLCRFGGHVQRFYSVAEHSLRIMALVSDRFKFEALMHDAVEAYMQDIPAPLKRFLPQYKHIERQVDSTIRNKYNLPPKISSTVHRADILIRDFEMCEVGLGPEPDGFEEHFGSLKSLKNKNPEEMFQYFIGAFNHFYR